MKKLNLLLLFISTIKVASGQICDGEQVVLTEDGQCNSNPFVLVFEDNFDVDTLDLLKWEIHPEQGSLEGGDSKQYYSLDNVTIGNGICNITAKKETVLRRAISWKPDNEILSDGLPNLRTYDYTSSWIWTKSKFGHGKFEINCKIPKGKSFWPAFWMYGENNGVNNEIDVFEFWDNSTQDHNMTVHYNGQMCLTDYNGPDYSLAFHTFTVVWDNYKIEWYVDGNLKRRSTRFYTMLGQEVDCNGIQAYGQYIRDNVFPRDEMNIIANLALQTGIFFQPDTNTPFPSSLEIDYVRMWKQVPLLPLPPPPLFYTCTPLNSNDKVVNDNHIHGSHTLHILNTITTDDEVTIENDANVWWTAGDYIELTPDFTVEEGAEFTAEIADCQHGFLKTIDINAHETAPYTGDPEPKRDNDDGSKQQASEPVIANSFLSPNPNNGKFTLQLKENMAGVCVYNSLGQAVFQSSTFNSQSLIDLSSQPKGIYFIQAISADKIYTEKVILR